MNRRESVDTVIQKIKDQLRSGGVADNLYRSVEGISQLAKAIYSHPYGTAWESKDRPLFTAGQQASLSRLFYNLKNDRHVGGDNNTARVAELMKMPVEEVEKMQNTPASASSGKFNPNEAYGVDEFYVGMMNKLNGVNSAVRGPRWATPDGTGCGSGQCVRGADARRLRSGGASPWRGGRRDCCSGSSACCCCGSQNAHSWRHC